MHRRSFLCLLTAAAVGGRIKAQETTHGAASNSRACCGRDNAQSGAKKAGRFYEAAVGVFQGKLKKVNKKEILIENDSNQMVSIRCSQKTKFLKSDQRIRPSDIDLDASVTVDAREDGNLNLLAIKVSVDSQPTKTISR